MCDMSTRRCMDITEPPPGAYVDVGLARHHFSRHGVQPLRATDCVVVDEDWGVARPYGVAHPDSLVPEVAVHQLKRLHAARAHLNEAPSSHDNVDILCCPDPRQPCTFFNRFTFLDSWRVAVQIHIDHHPFGLLPFLTALREPDVLPPLLPRRSGLPSLESLEVVHEFAANDLMLRMRVTPFGPFRGADDLHNVRAWRLRPNREAQAAWAAHVHAVSPRALPAAGSTQRQRRPGPRTPQRTCHLRVSVSPRPI